jgi:hypothetical protein
MGRACTFLAAAGLVPTEMNQVIIDMLVMRTRLDGDSLFIIPQ